MRKKSGTEERRSDNTNEKKREKIFMKEKEVNNEPIEKKEK